MCDEILGEVALEKVEPHVELGQRGQEELVVELAHDAVHGEPEVLVARERATIHVVRGPDVDDVLVPRQLVNARLGEWGAPLGFPCEVFRELSQRCTRAWSDRSQLVDGVVSQPKILHRDSSEEPGVVSPDKHRISIRRHAPRVLSARPGAAIARAIVARARSNSCPC